MNYSQNLIVLFLLQFLFPDAKDPLEKAKDDKETENSENNNNPKFEALLEVRLILIRFYD